MSKKLGAFLFILGCLAAGIYFCLAHTNTNAFSNRDCPFCKTSVLESQKFYEDEFVIALYTHKPVMPGHCLIIPKRHVERFEMLSDEEAAQISKVIKKVNQAVEKAYQTSSYLLLQKNGYEVGQTVPHIHFHYIPRKSGDDSIIKFIFKMFVVNIQKPIHSDEVGAAIEKIKMGMEN